MATWKVHSAVSSANALSQVMVHKIWAQCIYHILENITHSTYLSHSAAVYHHATVDSSGLRWLNMHTSVISSTMLCAEVEARAGAGATPTSSSTSFFTIRSSIFLKALSSDIWNTSWKSSTRKVRPQPNPAVKTVQLLNTSLSFLLTLRFRCAYMMEGSEVVLIRLDLRSCKMRDVLRLYIYIVADIVAGNSTICSE